MASTSSNDGSTHVRRAAARKLWLVYMFLFVVALIGLAILFIPTLEFTAFDLLDRLHIANRTMLAVAFWSECVMLVVSVLGLAVLSVRALRQRR